MSAEKFVHHVKAFDGLVLELAEFGAHEVEGFLLGEVAVFGVELVSITNKLLLKGFGNHVTDGQRITRAEDVLFGNACACVAFADESVTWKPDFSEQVCTENAVFDVEMWTYAAYRRGIGVEDANVVEHCSLGDKLAVNLELGVAVDALHSLVANALAVGDKDIIDVAAFGVVTLDDFKRVYHKIIHIWRLRSFSCGRS